MKQLGASPEKKPDRNAAIAALVKLGLTDAEAKNVVSAALPAPAGAPGQIRMVPWRYITTYASPDAHDDAGAGIEYDENGQPYINPGDPSKLPSEHGAHWSEMEVPANADGSIISVGPLIVVLPESMKPKGDVVDAKATTAVAASSSSSAPTPTAAATPVPPKRGKLADDFPGRDALVEAGADTYGKVRALDESDELLNVPGIGAATADKIRAALTT